jgi:hypothetical protein
MFILHKFLDMKAAKLIAIILFTSVVSISCVKQNLPDAGTLPTDKQKLADAKVPSDFNWSTGKNVELTITGLPTILPVKNTLTISLPDGNKLYNAYHEMSVNLKLTLVVPATVNELKLKYGSFDEILKIVNNKAEFSFIPVIPQEQE